MLLYFFFGLEQDLYILNKIFNHWIVFMYQARNMMITYASIPCGIWHYYGISLGAYLDNDNNGVRLTPIYRLRRFDSI